MSRPVSDIAVMIGKRMRYRRNELRLSMRELAKLAGLTATTINDTEHAHTRAKAETLLVIGKAMGVGVGYFLDDKEQLDDPLGILGICRDRSVVDDRVTD